MAQWLKRLFQAREATAAEAESVHDSEFPPLREFVYLDDVSVRSLLASQQGALPSEVKDLLNSGSEGELSGTVGAAVPLVPGIKAQAQSRYSVKSSQGSETSRQHVVQSLFREFRNLGNIHLLIEPIRFRVRPATVEELVSSANGGVREDEVVRGELVEIEVELIAERIFRFSSIISELSDMAADYPGMLASAPGAANVMREAGPINQVLQRMLVGLIPVRARATKLVVIADGDTRYIVDKEAAIAQGLSYEFLDIVGVTEQANFWKDTRRVLFGSERFTVLCRVARDGLNLNWRPVKLTNVLEEIAPQFADAIDSVGRTQYAPSNPVADRTKAALESFVAASLAKADLRDDQDVRTALDAVVEAAPENGASYSELTGLFVRLQDVLESVGGVAWDPEVWREMRADARKAGNVVSLPDAVDLESLGAESPGLDEDDGLLLDTEIIAIYW